MYQTSLAVLGYYLTSLRREQTWAEPLNVLVEEMQMSHGKAMRIQPKFLILWRLFCAADGLLPRTRPA